VKSGELPWVLRGQAGEPMTPAEARHHAARILRDASCSMRRDVSEAERLLRLAEGDDQEEVALRRSIEDERAINPEFFVELGP